MKSLLTSLLIFFGFISVKAQQDSVHNGSFEYWRPYPNGDIPLFWVTSDSLTNLFSGGPSAFIGSDPYSGSSSLHLKSTQIYYLGFPIKAPGIATNGDMEIDALGQSIVYKYGAHNYGRPGWLSGYYKYMPLNASERGFIKIHLLRNAHANSADTIATGEFIFSGTTSSYTQFVIVLNYQDSIHTPENCQINIQSSKSINDPDIIPGTELVIDSLCFGSTVGVNVPDNSLSSVKMYPIPADKEMSLEVELNTNAFLSYEVFDLKGKLILNSPMNSTKEIIDVRKLSNGKYILKLYDQSKRALYTTNFSITR